MNSRIWIVPVAAVWLSVPLHAASKSTSDIVSPQKRQQTVDNAKLLTRPPTPVPLPADLTSPYSPANFEQPDPEEQKGSGPAVAQSSSGAASSGGPARPSAPVGDRDLLESLAARIPSTGTIEAPGGKRLLVVGKYRLEAGQTFTVTNPATGQDCDLELIAIDRTTFTLRYRGEETTRPIRLK